MIHCLVVLALFSNPELDDSLHLAFNHSEWVHVVVALDDQAWPIRLEDQMARTNAVVEDALSNELNSGFVLESRFHTVPSLVGWMSRDTFRTLIAPRKYNSSIVAVSLDTALDSTEPTTATTAGKLLESTQLIGATLVHNQGIRGKGIEIAIIDSGIDSDHPDLLGALVAEACFCDSALGPCCPNGLNQQEGPGSAEDDEGHGTHVSGILTSDGVIASTGVAPDSVLSVVKGINFQGRGRLSNWVSGLDWLHMNRPDLKIVSMSIQAGVFEGVCDEGPAVIRSFYRAAQNLYDRGILLIAISGNQGQPAALSAPGCLSNVWAIGASDKMDIPWIASNSHDEVAFFAPGVDIVSSQIGGGSVSATGTSMAAPHVAGAAALLYEINPLLNQEDLRAELENTGLWIQDSHGLYRARIDVWQAFQEVNVGPFKRWLPFLTDDHSYQLNVALKNGSPFSQEVNLYPLAANGRALPRERLHLNPYETRVVPASSLFSEIPSHFAVVTAKQVTISVSMQAISGISLPVYVHESLQAATVFDSSAMSPSPNAAAIVNVGPSQSKVYVYQIAADGRVLRSKNYGYVPRFGQLAMRLDRDFPSVSGSYYRLVSSQISHAVFLAIQ